MHWVKYLWERRDAVLLGGALLLLCFFSFGGYKLIPQKNPAVQEVRERHPDLVLMDEVHRVSPAAAILLLSPALSLGHENPINCVVASRFDPLQESTAAGQRLVTDLKEKYARSCEFARAAKTSVYPLLRQIVSEQRLPSEVFRFEVALPPDEAQWRSVGPYADLPTCTAMHQVALEKGLGAKGCSRWEPAY